MVSFIKQTISKFVKTPASGKADPFSVNQVREGFYEKEGVRGNLGSP